MKHVTIAVWFSVGCVSGLAAPARAQTIAEPPPTGNMELGTQLGEVPGPVWSVWLSANQNFESALEDSSGQAGDWSQGFGGSLRYAKLLRRGGVDLNAEGNRSNFLSTEQFTYAAGVTSSYALTRRMNWSGTGFSSSTYAQDARLLTDSGIVFPWALTKTNGGSTAFRYNLSPQSDFGGSVGATVIDFDSPNLEGSSSVTFQGDFNRQLNPTHTIGVSFGHAISTITGDIQGLLGTWQGNFGPSLNLRASGGIRPYKVASGYHVAPGGSFALNLEFAQGQSLLARYERALEAAVGYGGTHIGDRYNLNYLFLVDRRLTLDGGASYGRNTYPEVVDFVLEGTTVDFGVSYLVADRLMVSGALSSWWSSTPGVPTTSGFRANFAVRYGFMWGERAAPPPVDIPTASEPARPPVAEPAK